MPDPSPYWPRTRTLVDEVIPPVYHGQQPSNEIERPIPGLAPRTTGARSARAYLDECFHRCGGIDGLVKWAKSEPSAFYPLYIKARCPKPVDEDGSDNQITIIVSGRTEPAVSKQVTQAAEQADESNRVNP